MYNKYLSCPVQNVEIHSKQDTGPFEWWRHTIGHGGINSLPLPEKVIQGSQKLKPRLLRTFLQEYFDIYPDHGVFDWTKLDPYMDSLHRTGAEVVACITMKPPVLYPVIDQTIWRPNNVEEWQNVVYELVKRYSVERQIVTYWEIGNETDIGEWGGCPYLIKEPEDYYEYYQWTIEPILRAFPSAKIGGPAVAIPEDKLLLGFIDLCHSRGTQLDFVSWHIYNDDPEQHKRLVVNTKAHLAQFGQNRPEMLVTEWNKGFDKVSVEELAMMPRRAAAVAASILDMMEAGLDWSFYYHVWDQTNYPSEFGRFYNDLSIMTIHWNEIPHRFGMFGVSGEVRPPYFVYQMMGRMGDRQVRSNSEDPNLRVSAVSGDRKLSVMIANYNVNESADTIATVVIPDLTPGRKQLIVHKIDENRNWNEEALELNPCENREIAVLPEGGFRFQVYCAAESVTFVTIEDLL